MLRFEELHLHRMAGPTCSLWIARSALAAFVMTHGSHASTCLIEVLDEGAELADVAALVDGVAERLVAGDHRVAAVPGGGGLGVQPEHVAGPLGNGLERAFAGIVVVGAGVAEDDHGGAPAYLLAPEIPEGGQRVAVVRPAVQPHAAARGVDVPRRLDHVGGLLQHVGHLVHASTNTKLRTRENCDRSANASCRVKAAKVDTEPEMSASTNSSGLAGCGLRKAGRTGTPPVLSDRRTVRLKSSAPRRLWRRLAASRPASLRVSGSSTARMSAIWSREEVRKSTSSGSGRRRVRATAAAPRSSTRRCRTCASTIWRNLSSWAS